jgi:hypothetical protein
MRAWLVALVFVLGANEARAEPIPAALRGKSIVLGWTSTKTQMRINGTHPDLQYATGTSIIVKVYMSVQGRVFSSYYKGNMFGPTPTFNEISGNTENVLKLHFDGAALVADEVLTQGVRRTIVNFTDGFSACSVSVIYGKKNGTEPLIVKGESPNEQQLFEIVDYKLTATNCSVQQGNIFASPPSPN